MKSDMSGKPIQIRAKHTKGTTTVRALIQHPMTGARKTAAGTEVTTTPHFIQEVTCRLGDETVLSAYWGSDIAKDPFLSFSFKGGKSGETILLSWVDSMGERDSIETIIA